MAQAKGWIVETVLAVLNWLNSPWKIVALTLLIPVIVASLIVWDQRVVIVTFYSNPRTVEWEIDRRAAPRVLVDVLAETHGVAAAVSLWDIDANRRVHVIALNKEGRELDVQPRIMPIVRSPNLSSVILPALLAGEVPCLSNIPPPPRPGELDRIPPDLRRIAVSEGAVAYCVSGIPGARSVLIGSLTVLFGEPPPDVASVAAAMRRAARQLLQAEVGG